MALNKATLKTDILDLLTLMRTKESVCDEEFAERLSTAIDTYIKAAEIIVAPGIAVSTTGGPAAQTGATTASGKGTIS